MRPFVRVVGVSLLAGCAKPPDPGPGNPPEPPRTDGGTATIPEVGTAPTGPTVLHPGPPGAPPQLPTANPPPPLTLPTWDQVPSGHPPGATNPPFPVLVVARDTGECFKEWFGGMIPPPPRQREAGGLVLETRAEAADRRATQVVCPPGEPAALLEKWDHPTPEK